MNLTDLQMIETLLKENELLRDQKEFQERSHAAWQDHVALHQEQSQRQSDALEGILTVLKELLYTYQARTQ